MKTLTRSCLLVAVLSAGAIPAFPAERAVSLTQDPLVMRLNKDEFRIAFGVNGEHCAASGCSGSIRYRVDWRTATGTTGSEMKQVSFTVAPGTTRTIAVDRQFFDTAEGANTTDVVKVSVAAIRCRPRSATTP